jgi:hypothetical protein
VLKNRTAPQIERAVVDLAIEQPAWGQVRVSEALKRQGLSISPAGVRCVWQRHDLTSIKHRLKALEAKVAQDGILLTEAQIAALEKAKADKEAHGEFESECPGYCGAQDTFYVGTLKGVGRVYQQTVIDTYAKVAFAKLYDRKTPITAAEILNDRVVPFYDEHDIRLSRMLTDRGTEFCGTQSHEYELYLAVCVNSLETLTIGAMRQCDSMANHSAFNRRLRIIGYGDQHQPMTSRPIGRCGRHEERIIRIEQTILAQLDYTCKAETQSAEKSVTEFHKTVTRICAY